LTNQPESSHKRGVLVTRNNIVILGELSGFTGA
jgi:hypothetical protein